MSVALIPDAQKSATDEQSSVQKMLIENGRLIEAIAEYQRLGRPAEAMKYHELLHKNLIFLSNLVDPQLSQSVQSITVVEPQAETATTPPATEPSNGSAPPSAPEENGQYQQMNGGSPQASPNGIPQVQPPQQ
jgi:hypothetical protein